VQRTVVTAGQGADGILTSVEEPAANPFDTEQSKTRLLWALQASVSALGEAKFAAAAIVAVNADFNRKYDQATWKEISAQVDRARECDPAAPERTTACALTSFQQTVEKAESSTSDDPGIALAYWTDPQLIDSSNLESAKAIHQALQERTLESLKDLRAKLKDRAMPFPWFISSNVDWPMERLNKKWREFFGVREAWDEFIAGFWGKLLTALMVAMGAPFWYEIIGKVVNVRGTGSKPAT
jgi:hypothetical protein